LLAGTPARIVEGFSVIGGGSTPEQALPTYLIAVESEQVASLERRLREGDPAVVARIEDERLLLDLRTVLPEEEALLVKAVLSAAGS
jgi:L-seryl-tRNA(Ser) seleniumtransferase